MKYLSLTYFIIASLIFQFTSCKEQKQATVSKIEISKTADAIKANKTNFILVRHAEKDTIKGDPNLTQIGLKRAADLSDLLKDIPVTAIYSSDFKRTRQTAKPTAIAKGLDINIYNHKELGTVAEEILAKHANGIILVVGHSHSTPNFANHLLGDEKIAFIDESDYDNLFVVNATKVADAEVTHLHYGKQD